MLLIKFNKVGAFAFISHLDCRKVIVQTIKRAGIEVNLSQGFNPHELLFFSPPTSLGVQSYCEYMYIDTPCNDADNFKHLINIYAPKGLEVVNTKFIENKPDFYDTIEYAEYKITFDDVVNKEFINFDNTPEIKSKILEVNFDAQTIQCIVACGQKQNLKVSDLIDCLTKDNSLKVNEISKIQLFKKLDDKLVSIDEILF